MESQAVSIELPTEGLAVSGLWSRPADAKVALLLAHGAGAGMRHAFLARISSELAERSVATLRYQFPYTETGRRRPDRAARLQKTVEAAAAKGLELDATLPWFAGGKSMGGRMSSQSAAAGGLTAVRGLVFFGFPLHPAGRPGVERAAHLSEVSVPMLFLQGTRDRLAELALLQPICKELASLATLHVVEGGDHGFEVLKRSGRTGDEVMAELVTVATEWMHQTVRA